MTLNFIIVGIFFISTVAVIAANQRQKRKEYNKISFKEAMDLTELPVVTFQNNNQKLNFLLDTGSNDSHINSSILPLLKYEKTHIKKRTTGMEGNSVYNNICNMTIAYKDKLFNTDFNINDLDAAFEVVKKESGVQIHGILGSIFFQRYKYVLDFDSLIAYSK